MNAHRLIVLLVLVSFGATAQQRTTGTAYITFEEGLPSWFRLWRDTVSNPANIWHIGKPVKSVFTAAHSPQKVICTDTLNPYPTNDTSIFYISQRATGSGWISPVPSFQALMFGWYRIDSDTLTDYGSIELSPDNGQTWIDLIKDTVFKITQPFNNSPVIPKPVLSGRSAGWRSFGWYFGRIADSFNVQYGDTILTRFTFVSDSGQTNRDGLMFDDLSFVDVFEGIATLATLFESYPFPNPATSTIHFTLSAKEQDAWRISLYTLHGQKVKTETIRRGAPHQLSVAELPPGPYYYTITGERTYQTSSGSVIISR